MSAAHNHRHMQHLPPSPPPSPPSTRQRKKKKPDPFEQLATTPIPSLPSSPANELNDDQEPLLKRIILTPVLFTSFLLSLFLVNYRNRARRTEAHSLSFSLLAYLAPSSWLDPEPYQDPDDSKWGRRGTTGHVEPHDAIGPRSDEQDDEKPKKRKKRKSWHLHKKIRKVAKLEIGDALEMRGRMIVVMLVVLGLACAILWMGVSIDRFLELSENGNSVPELPKEEEKMRTGVVEKPFHHENMFIGASVIQTSNYLAKKAKEKRQDEDMGYFFDRLVARLFTMRP